MATYHLSGAGVQGLTSGTLKLFVTVDTFPLVYTVGRATPPNYYGIGLLRLGEHGAYYAAVPIDATDMVMLVPFGADVLGFSLFDRVNITVVESAT